MCGLFILDREYKLRMSVHGLCSLRHVLADTSQRVMYIHQIRPIFAFGTFV